ncbi:glycoside hydrolase family 127 protein [Paenibacillus sp. alder61]|uniref:beta-L-arabinofuranosidase domain-containing protein n=1 Tax=Paenibacillus sp. alder61 TaxID=2862948 RepID=UPI001CD359BF|nr:beta-L-arabinofuranosidase domain-containing protein [Paenibacillus sp. alder61]MCA1295301.1 glycoside hydrolase family 127 protein [Paenibacillus sp. alder61]
MGTVTENEIIVLKDMEALYLGNLGTVEFNLNLPREGKYGSSITWQSEDTRFLRPDGSVFRPKYGIGKRTVRLRASFQYGDCVKEKIYEVTILEEPNNIQVTRIYPLHLQAETGAVYHLPSVAVVETEEHEVLSHPVDWEEGEERLFSQTGTFQVYGVLRDTSIPVYAEVQVSGERNKEIVSTAPTVHVFPAHRIRLKDGTEFKAAQDRSLKFLKTVDDDQMLFNFRAAAGLDTLGAPEMTGWDSPECLLRGHTTGHYLSALALCYAATGDGEIKRKAEYIIDSLAECQRAFSGKPGFREGFLSGYSEEQFDLLERFTRYPEIWAPYYTLHKIFAGLLDGYRYLDNETALTVADKLGDWVYRRLSRLPKPVLNKMWSMYIAGEYGGMNESLAELHSITGKPEHLAAAKLFDNDRLFVPMFEGIDALGGLHANQHIPQVLGALKIFQVTGEKRYYELASFFWRAVTEAHIYSIGGTGEGEMFRQPGRIGDYLSDKTAETCASYNMLKLTKELFAYRPEAAMMDYYERTMFNHILASCDSEPTGGSTYFMPLGPGWTKSFDSTENTCCHGTGLENHFKYAEGIYFHKADTLYVNLFVSSTLDWPERKLKITQEADKRHPGNVTLKFEGSGTLDLKIRLPHWASGNYKVMVNDQEMDDVANDNGYLSIRREWRDGDTVKLGFGCSLRLEAAPDRKERVSLAYGPYVLAALSDVKEFLRLPLRTERLEEQFTKETGSPGLAFRYNKADLLFVPLADVHHESYHVYFELI